MTVFNILTPVASNKDIRECGCLCGGALFSKEGI